ncbi:Vesicle-fusing ATPase [Pyrenophora tritici-repentis]|nr:Vesicle-fusing ATPase [Pyrenophora tritici-repentis]
MAIDSGYPFIKLISAEDMIGYSEMQKVQQLDKTFRGRVQETAVFLIFATTTERSVLTQLDLFARFDAEIAVPNVKHAGGTRKCVARIRRLFRPRPAACD